MECGYFIQTPSWDLQASFIESFSLLGQLAVLFTETLSLRLVGEAGVRTYYEQLVLTTNA